MVTAFAVRGERNLNSALLRKHGSIDEGNWVMYQVLEDTLECTEFKYTNIVINDIAEDFNVNALNSIASKAAGNKTELFGQRNQRLDLISHLATLDVHSVRHEFTSKSQTHRTGNRDTGLFLRFVS
ncbi:unannotated protein [freshwater metagenome]|uniref:Unannotated protein n=1 Tax=freshwater metagenome TaxID=449393 RepID=A0A6J6M3N6_9ZZZZ